MALAESISRCRCCSRWKTRPSYTRSPSHTASPPCAVNGQCGYQPQPPPSTRTFCMYVRTYLHGRVEDADFRRLAREQAVADPHQKVHVLWVRCEQPPLQPVVCDGGGGCAIVAVAAVWSDPLDVGCDNRLIVCHAPRCIHPSIHPPTNRTHLMLLLSADGRMACAARAS